MCGRFFIISFASFVLFLPALEVPMHWEPPMLEEIEQKRHSTSDTRENKGYHCVNHYMDQSSNFCDL